MPKIKTTSDRVYLQISEIAKRAGVTLRTVRYYEERGLLPPSSCTSGGIRLYSERDVNRLIFIKHLRKIGLDLEQIGLCLNKLPAESSRRQRVKHTQVLLREQKDRIEEQLTELDDIKSQIENSLVILDKCLTCSSKKCSESCPQYAHIL